MGQGMRYAVIMAVVLVIDLPLGGGADGGVEVLRSSPPACLQTDSARQVYAARCTGEALQRWLALPDGRLRNAGTGRCLGVKPSATLFAYRCTGDRELRWTPVRVRDGMRVLRQAERGAVVTAAGDRLLTR